MANWKEKIELAEVLRKVSDENDLSEVERVCPKVVKDALCKEITKSSRLKHFVPRIRSARSIAAVNRVIEQVYNTADVEKVWCGL